MRLDKSTASPVPGRLAALMRGNAEIRAALAADPLLSSRELSILCGVGIQSVQRWAREGRLPYLQAGRQGRLRFRLSAVKQLLQEHEHGQAND